MGPARRPVRPAGGDIDTRAAESVGSPGATGGSDVSGWRRRTNTPRIEPPDGLRAHRALSPEANGRYSARLSRKAILADGHGTTWREAVTDEQNRHAQQSWPAECAHPRRPPFVRATVSVTSRTRRGQPVSGARSACGIPRGRAHNAALRSPDDEQESRGIRRSRARCRASATPDRRSDDASHSTSRCASHLPTSPTQPR
jgi:hypothetical protein